MIKKLFLFVLILVSLSSLGFSQPKIKFENPNLKVSKGIYDRNYVIFVFQNIGDDTLRIKRIVSEPQEIYSCSNKVPPGKWGVIQKLYLQFPQYQNGYISKIKVYSNTESGVDEISWAIEDVKEYQIDLSRSFCKTNHNTISSVYRVVNTDYSAGLNVKLNELDTIVDYSKVSFFLTKVSGKYRRSNTIQFKANQAEILVYNQNSTQPFSFHKLNFEPINFDWYFHCHPKVYFDDGTLTKNYSNVVIDTNVFTSKIDSSGTCVFNVNLYNSSDRPIYIRYIDVSNQKFEIKACANCILPKTSEKIRFEFTKKDYLGSFYDGSCTVEFLFCEQNSEIVRIKLVANK